MLLSAAITEYVDHVTATGKPVSTAKDREQSLKAFLRTSGDIHTAKVTPRHVDQFFTANKHWGAGTRNNRLSHLRGFFKWCRFRRYMPLDSDPTYGWEALDYLPSEKVRIPRTQWPVLFEHCETELETITVAVGLYTMMRGSELRRIQLKHVLVNASRPVIIRTVTKGKHRRQPMPISTELEPYVRRHLTWMAEQGFTDPEHYFIPTYYSPVNAKGTGKFVPGSRTINPTKPICRPYDTIKRVLGRAGFATHREGVHTLRRSGARALYEAGLEHGYDGALIRVSTMLGHAKQDVTERYIGVDLRQELVLQEFAGKPMFPVDNGNVVKMRREG
jgi:integrase